MLSCLRAPTVTLKQYQPPTCAAARSPRIFSTPDVSYLTTQYPKLKTQNKHSDFPLTVAPFLGTQASALSIHPGPPEHSTHQIHSHRPRQRGLAIPHKPEPESDPDIMRLRAA